MKKITVFASIFLSLTLAGLTGCMADQASPEDTGDPEQASAGADTGRAADPAASKDKEGEDVGEAESAALTSCCGSVHVCGPPPPCHVDFSCTGFPPTCRGVTVCPPPSCADIPIPCPTCAHSACSQGVALNATCNSDVAVICAQDPWCCSVSWDGVCVGEMSSIAHRQCNSCN